MFCLGWFSLLIQTTEEKKCFFCWFFFAHWPRKKEKEMTCSLDQQILVPPTQLSFIRIPQILPGNGRSKRKQLYHKTVTYVIPCYYCFFLSWFLSKHRKSCSFYWKLSCHICASTIKNPCAFSWRWNHDDRMYGRNSARLHMQEHSYNLNHGSKCKVWSNLKWCSHWKIQYQSFLVMFGYICS